MSSSLEKRLAALECARPTVLELDAAMRGVAELERLGINLSKVSVAGLRRLEQMLLTWAEDVLVPPAAIWAALDYHPKGGG